MFGRLMPTEGKFFDLFNQHAELCVKGAKEMLALMSNFDDLENRVHAIESIEKQADKITYATVDLLHNMDNSRKIVAICEEIDRLESDADHVMRAAMSKLFRDEPDVRNLIKMKAIYELLETVTDRCEDVANIIEGIIVENA